MIRRTEIGDSGITLADAKQFMGFVGRTDRDEEIQTFLGSATAIVEEYQNVSLRPMTVVLPLSGGSTSYKLYLQPVSEVVSVKDADTGGDVPYQVTYLKDRILVNTQQPLVVEYKTESINDEMVRVYKPAILSMASLMFDGSTDTEAYRKVFNSFMIPSLL